MPFTHNDLLIVKQIKASKKLRMKNNNNENQSYIMCKILEKNILMYYCASCLHSRCLQSQLWFSKLHDAYKTCITPITNEIEFISIYL